MMKYRTSESGEFFLPSRENIFAATIDPTFRVSITRRCIIDYFMALLAWILTLSRRLFSGPACEGQQQGSADGFEPGLPAVTGLREQDAHSASFQQAIRHMRPAGLEDHGR